MYSPSNHVASKNVEFLLCVRRCSQHLDAREENNEPSTYSSCGIDHRQLILKREKCKLQNERMTARPPTRSPYMVTIYEERKLRLRSTAQEIGSDAHT
jgi:hypothetical protein